MSPASSQVTTIFELPPPNRDPRTLTRLYSQELEKGGTLYRQGAHVCVMRSRFQAVIV